MDNELKKRKRKLSIGETIWVVIESLFGGAGLVLLVLGVVSDYLPLAYSDNYIATAESAWMSFSHTNLTFRALGVIAILIGAFLAVIALNHYAKKSDADEEREIRRAQRLQVLNASEKTEDAKEVSSSAQGEAK